MLATHAKSGGAAYSETSTTAWADQARTVQRLLGTLDEGKRVVVVMSELEGMTAVEISSVLGVSTATVERDLRAARAWLQMQLGARAQHGP